jgi:hypothetical protein
VFDATCQTTKFAYIEELSGGKAWISTDDFVRSSFWRRDRHDLPPLSKNKALQAPTAVATRALSALRGGAQSKLMLCDDNHPWVVKFRNNPQHPRVLVNDFVATRMAEAIGLSVPTTGVIEVSEWLVENSPQLRMDYGCKGGLEPCSSGLQFGSRFVGGLMPGHTLDVLPEDRLKLVRNIKEFFGMLAFDKWTCNRDGRQVVYQRSAKGRQYKAVFIDQGFCFGTPEWKFIDAPLQGTFALKWVYAGIKQWDDFEPWLTKIEQFDPQRLWNIAASVPDQWYGGECGELERLIDVLLKRRNRVRELIDQFRQSDARPFPLWQVKAQTSVRSQTPAKSTTRPSKAIGEIAIEPILSSGSRNSDLPRTHRDSEQLWKHEVTIKMPLHLPPALDQWLARHAL